VVHLARGSHDAVIRDARQRFGDAAGHPALAAVQALEPRAPIRDHQRLLQKISRWRRRAQRPDFG